MQKKLQEQLKRQKQCKKVNIDKNIEKLKKKRENTCKTQRKNLVYFSIFNCLSNK